MLGESNSWAFPLVFISWLVWSFDVFDVDECTSVADRLDDRLSVRARFSDWLKVRPPRCRTLCGLVAVEAMAAAAAASAASAADRPLLAPVLRVVPLTIMQIYESCA